MQQTLEYISGNGPFGYVVYNNGLNQLKLFYEFGGGNCVAIITVPNKQEWTKQTQFNTEERDPILIFIAEQCIKDQAPDSKYELLDDCIKILSLK